MNTAPVSKIPIPNTAKTTTIVWGVLSVVFFIGIFTPFLADSFGAETSDWMFALMMFSLVLFITSIIVIVMYAKRARAVGNMLQGKNLLAHWTYTEEEWNRYSKKENKEFTQHNKSLFFLVAVIAVIVGIILIIFNPGDWAIFAVIILGIIAIAGISALLAVTLSKRQNQKFHGEAYITADGVFLNRVLHLWKGFGAALEGVGYEDKDREIPVITINYSIPGRYSRQPWTVRVPVPHGHEAEAEIVTQQLQNRRKPNEKI